MSEAKAPIPYIQVAAALLVRHDKVVLVKEYRGGDTMWSIPGGGVEPGELAVEAVRREVQEETGLLVEAVDGLAYVVNTDSKAYPSALCAVFKISQWSGELASVDPDEKISQAVLLPVAEAVELLNKPSVAGRAEIEPLVAFLAGQVPLGQLWSYRENDLI